MTYNAFRLFFLSVCVPRELNPPFALLTQCSTTEPQEHGVVIIFCNTAFTIFYWSNTCSLGEHKTSEILKTPCFWMVVCVCNLENALSDQYIAVYHRPPVCLVETFLFVLFIMWFQLPETAVIFHIPLNVQCFLFRSPQASRLFKIFFIICAFYTLLFSI